MMKSLMLAAAAALSLGALGAAPALAQPDRMHDMNMQTDRHDTHMGDRQDRDMRDRHDTMGDRRDGDMRDRHDGRRDDDRGRRNWRDGDRGHHYGWRNHRHQNCRMVWRHHHRVRVCNNWR